MSKPSSFAIAVGTQRQMRNKKKKMADGGPVPAPKTSPAPDVHQAANQEMKSIASGIDSRMKDKQATGMPGYAQGGMIDSIADAVIERIHRKMAKGGMVDIQENGEEAGQTPYDDMNADAAEDPVYDDEQLSDQPEDSNTKGDSEEDAAEDKDDRVSAIRKRMKSR